MPFYCAFLKQFSSGVYIISVLSRQYVKVIRHFTLCHKTVSSNTVATGCMRLGFPMAQWEESTCQCRRPEFDPRVRRIPWRRKWRPSPVLKKIHRTGEPGGLQSMGSQRVRHDSAIKHAHMTTKHLICG